MQTKEFIEDIFKDQGITYSEEERWFGTIYSFEVKIATVLNGTLAKVKATKDNPEDIELAKEYVRKTFLVSIVKSALPELKDAAEERVSKLN